MHNLERVVIGTVGYYAFLRGYPLGPKLMERLQGIAWPVSVTIAEMNWGPVAIVQDFQSRRVAYDRAVLVASVDRGEQPGTVTCRRWQGGELDALALQERMHEAVTGVISLDNLLIIGEHFKIWPEEVITVELQSEANDFGDFVLTEMREQQHEFGVVGERPIAAEADAAVTRLVACTRRAAIEGTRGMPGLPTLNAKDLSPVRKVSHHRFVGTESRPKRD